MGKSLSGSALAICFHTISVSDIKNSPKTSNRLRTGNQFPAFGGINCLNNLSRNAIHTSDLLAAVPAHSTAPESILMLPMAIATKPNHLIYPLFYRTPINPIHEGVFRDCHRPIHLQPGKHLALTCWLLKISQKLSFFATDSCITVNGGKSFIVTLRTCRAVITINSSSRFSMLSVYTFS